MNSRNAFRCMAIALTAAIGASSVIASNLPDYRISPVPQQIVMGDGPALEVGAFDLKFLPGAGPDERALLSGALPTGKRGLRLMVGLRSDKQMRKYADRVPEHAEGYYINVGPKEVVIAGADTVGLYYGIKSFLQMYRSGSLWPVEVADWPSISVRGVIEGFYGNPWSHTDRMRQFDFYGDNKMNIYIYGPKDDPYHHSRWYEPYPANLAAELQELVAHSAANKVKFVWAMHPSNSIVSDADRNLALEKFQQMYDLGVRDFAVFFDDISAESVDAQIDYVNFLTDNFVRTHEGVLPLIVCPTQYNRLWSGGDYLSKMGEGLYPEVRIMWTGNSVVDMIDRADCEWFEGQTGRAPFIWLNYPVNDFGLHHLLMGPMVGNGTDIASDVSAFCSNPMQYAEASKVALYGVADYAWNPEKYDADESWLRATSEMAPGHVEAFRDFCRDNDDVGPSVHTPLDFRMLESPGFKAILDRFSGLTAESAPEYDAYFGRMCSSADELLAAESKLPELIGEIREFIQYYGLQGGRGHEAVAMRRALDSGDADAFVDAFRRYSDLTSKGEGLVSRGFEGSIQSVAPRSGSLYIEPFITSEVRVMTEEFKRAGYACPDGLFPEQSVPNGTYCIVADGMYLSNPRESEHPVFQNEVDEVNPGRQLWVVVYDAPSGCFKVANEWDKRWLDHKGAYDDGAFDAAKCGFYLVPDGNGSYALCYDERGGIRYMTCKDERLKPGRWSNDTDAYVFRLVPPGELAGGKVSF